jgi:hypothetical protein
MSAEQLKVVAHKIDGTLLKGFAQDWPDLHSVTSKPAPLSFPQAVRLQLRDSRQSVEVPVSELKALFLVKSFEGSREYNEVKFFKAHPLVEGLWIRLRFKDNETTEGVVYNSLHYLVSDGFVLKPPDPGSNNNAVFVMKSSLADFRILGVRGSY